MTLDRSEPRLEYPRYYSLSDNGDYYVANSATPGTGVTYKIEQAFSDSSAFVCLFNSDTGSAVTGQAKRLYLDYISMIQTVVPTNASSVEVICKLDSINKVSSGGTVLTSNLANMDLTRTAKTTVTVGAPTLTAASANVRVMNREKILTVIPRNGDTYLFQFGPEYKGFAGGVLNGTNPQQIAFPGPPLVIGPSQSFSLHLWHPASTVAPAYEVEIGFWER